MKFAKIVELAESQVLVTVNTNSEDEPIVSISAMVGSGDAVLATVTMTFEDSEEGYSDRDSILSTFNEQAAKFFYKKLVDQFNSDEKLNKGRADYEGTPNNEGEASDKLSETTTLH